MMPRIDATTDLYCLVGMGISYSLSPAIHNHIFELIGDNSVYLAFDIAEESFDIAFRGLLEISRGLNITIPYKERAIKYLKELEPIVEKIGAINTVYMKRGYNTDYLAIKQLVRERFGGLDGMKCLVAGAGGAAKASSYALGDLGCSIYIMNRTRARAEELVARLRDSRYEAYITENCSEGYDVVLNATPDPSYIPASCLRSALIIDLVYRPVKTRLIIAAIERGIPFINGLEILVRQALLAQGIWHGRDLLHLEEEVMRYLCREIPSVEC
ncbi:MAG: shikimate dehydrogenase [Sulfolobales archaeon]